jgi:hypothetical protein
LNTSFFIVLLFLFLAVLLIARKNKDLGLPLLLFVLTLKILAGVAFLTIYSNHYGSGTLSADAQKFMDESKVLNKVFSESPGDYFKFLFGWDNDPQLAKKYLEETHHWDSNSQLLINDNRNLMRIHSLIHFFSGNSVYVHLLIFAFISFLSSLILTRGLKEWLAIDQKWVLTGLALIPSVLFWSSSVLKEPMLFLGISLLLYGLLRKMTITKRLVLIIFGSLLILSFKPYILFSILPALLIYWLYIQLSLVRFAFVSGIIVVTSVVFLLSSSTGQRFAEKLSRKQFDFLNISQGGAHLMGDGSFLYLAPEQLKLTTKKEDTIYIIKDLNALQFDYSYTYAPQTISLKKGEKYTVFFQGDVSESYIPTTPIEKDPVQLLKNIPESLINVLFRPLPGDPGSWLKFPAMLENLLLFGALFLLFKHIRTADRKQIALILSILTFALTLSLLIGWVTPVLGAINRYRTPVFLGFGVIILLLWSNKLKSRKT